MERLARQSPNFSQDDQDGSSIQILALLVFFPPITIFLVFNIWMNTDYFLLCALSSFIISLSMSHFYLYINKERSSPKIPQHIDYIYLICGMLGIIGVFDVKGKIEDLRFNQAKIIIEDLNSQISDKLGLAIEECGNASSAACQSPREIQKSINEALYEYRIHKNLVKDGKSRDNIVNLVPDDFITLHDRSDEFNIHRVLSVVYQKYENAIGPWQQHIKYFLIKHKYYEQVYIERDSHSMIFNEYLRLLGIYFVASALAIRIAKTSVENFGWRMK